MRPHTSGEGGIGPSEKTTPRTPHTAPFLSTEHSTTFSVTPSRPAKGAFDDDRTTIDHAEEGVEAESNTSADAEATFLGYSRVTNTGLIVTTFLVNEELVPINIEKIPGNHRLFNLVFIICF